MVESEDDERVCWKPNTGNRREVTIEVTEEGKHGLGNNEQ